MVDAQTIVTCLTLSNKRGLHARAAAKFVAVVDQFNADIKVQKDGHVVGGSSIMGLLMLAMPCGDSFSLQASGDEARAAVEALETLIAERFGEPE
ncbi:MAG: HPr family phosphocarrier protein [Pseudomonadota bacterium]